MTEPLNPQRAFFDEVRKRTYSMVGNYTDQEAFTEAVLEQARQLNDSGGFARTPNQVDRTATSAAEWTWKNLVTGAVEQDSLDAADQDIEPGPLPRYRFIALPLDNLEQFEKLINELLDQGYELAGPTSLTHIGSDTIAGQALLLPS